VYGDVGAALPRFLCVHAQGPQLKYAANGVHYLPVTYSAHQKPKAATGIIILHHSRSF
jgi:hypothetical protein